MVLVARRLISALINFVGFEPRRPYSIGVGNLALKGPADPQPMTKGMQAYGDASYWDNRYRDDSVAFDWYQRYSGLAPLMAKYIPKTSKVLMVGCGNAVLSEDMVNDGYTEVWNIDISTVVIEAMQNKYKDVPQLKYAVMDVREMSTLGDGQFEAVVDKGMLDSLMCGTNGPVSATKMMEEVYRVLKSGGKYMLITYGDPRVRLPHLKQPQINWTVTLHVLPRPGKSITTADPNVYMDPVPLNEDGSIGNHSALENTDLHYIYVCTKGTETTKKAAGKAGKK